jgi:transcriptional regulator with GAF, ATPase, and Fis domain
MGAPLNRKGTSTANMNTHSESPLIGDSDAMRTLHGDVECAARWGVRVLLTGESGAGKEVVARLIHQRGQRSEKPFVTINCAGVRTRCSNRSSSVTFVAASRTAIEPGADGSSRRIAATNRDLMSLVTDKRFREDLYYRLNVIHVRVPPPASARKTSRHCCRTFSNSTARDMA